MEKVILKKSDRIWIGILGIVGLLMIPVILGFLSGLVVFLFKLGYWVWS